MNSKSNAELLPCPHCGESEELYPAYRSFDGGIPYAIDCLGCGADFVPPVGKYALPWSYDQFSGDYLDAGGHLISLGDEAVWRHIIKAANGAHTPPAGHVVVPVEVMQARLDTLDACLETFWCITKEGSDNRLIAEGAQHEAASLRALLPHNQGGA